MSKQVQIKPDEIPEGWSSDAADLINKVRTNILIFLSYCKENLRID